MRKTAISTLVLAAVLGGGCSNYSQTMDATTSIWDVRVVQRADEVAGCRFLADVDSTASQPGCGLTVQPTTEECLRFQVRYAGGDTLLVNGLVGKAYDCGRFTPTPAASPTTPATETPTPRPAAPSPAPPATPTPGAPAPAPASPAVSTAGVRIVRSREMVRGCVYLDDMDPAECGSEPASSREACISERAGKAGGNTVLLEGDRAEIFECRGTP
jgi:hypothetical protein